MHAPPLTLSALCHAPATPQAEYERVKVAYQAMSASLESLSGEKRALEAQVARVEAEARRSERERRCGARGCWDLCVVWWIYGWVGGWTRWWNPMKWSCHAVARRAGHQAAVQPAVPYFLVCTPTRA